MSDQSQKFVKSMSPDLYLGAQDALFATQAQVEVGYRFYNGLAVPVTISLRSGVKYIIPPIPGVRSSRFIVVADFCHSRNVNFDTTDLLDANGELSTPEHKAIDSAIQASTLGPFLMGQKPPNSAVKYALSKRDLDKNGGQLYLSNVDVLVSIYSLDRTSSHPATLKAQCNDFLNDDPLLSNLKGFSFTVQIVDRRNVFGERFVNVCGKIFRIPVSQDPDKTEGVFIRHNGESAGGDVTFDIPDAIYYSFDEANKIPWLYETHREAMVLGDQELTQQRDLMERKHELQRLELEHKAEEMVRKTAFENEKREFEREREQVKREELTRNQRIADREYEIRTLEVEMAHREKLWKAEEAIREARLEKQAAQHKARMEWVKIVPAVLGVVGAGIALFKQLSK